MLIKTNKAALIDSADDIEFQLDWGEGSTEKNNPQLSLFTELSADEQAVFNVVRERGQEVIDVICFKTKFPVAKVSALLLNLEFAGLVKSRPGKVYSLTRSL